MRARIEKDADYKSSEIGGEEVDNSTIVNEAASTSTLDAKGSSRTLKIGIGNAEFTGNKSEDAAVFFGSINYLIK